MPDLTDALLYSLLAVCVVVIWIGAAFLVAWIFGRIHNLGRNHPRPEKTKVTDDNHK